MAVNDATRTAAERESDRHPAHHVRNVYLRPPVPVEEGRRLGWLPRRLGLEHYSPQLLTRKIATELTVIAALLVAIFAFEFAAWAFFFNGIFVGDLGRFHGAGTPAAIGLALVFAGVIFYFERQVITADSLRLTDEQRKRAQRIRVLSILVAGFIIAHAVDLLAFKVPVATKAHREEVHEEALRLAQDISGLEALRDEIRKNPISEEIERVRSLMETTQQQRDLAAAELERSRKQAGLLRSEATKHSAAARAAQDDLTRVEGLAADSGIRRIERELEAARSRYDVLTSELAAAIGNQGANSVVVLSADRQLKNLMLKDAQLRDKKSALEVHAELLGATIEKLKSRLRSWIGYLERSKPGQHTEKWSGWKDVSEHERRLWPEHWRQPLEFEGADKNFFEKVETVYELAFGKAWRWLNGSGQQRAEMPSYLPSEELREEEPWVSYFFIYLGVHLAAIFVPFLVFAVKWYLMPKEVDAYFSAWHQAMGGDPEARLILSIEEKVRQRNEHW